MNSLGKEWIDYQSLMKSRPEAFVNTGNIHIVTDSVIVEEFQKKSGRIIGVVYSSPYHLMVVDLVYTRKGEYFPYERVMSRTPGSAVVVVPRCNGNFLLLKQYRHALREYQYAFPRGFGEEGISAAKNVCKEIAEELSANASAMQFLGTCIADSGLCGDKVNVYSCKVDHFTIKKGYEGITDIISLSEEELACWIRSGKLNDGFTLSAYSLLSAQK